MVSVVKYLKILAFPGLLLFPVLCFPQAGPAGEESRQKPVEDAGNPPATPDAIFPAIVAKVNGEAISGRDLEELVRLELSAIGNPEWKNLRGDYRGELTLSKITALINSKLLFQQAKASGIKVPDAEVQAEMQKIAKTFSSEAEMNAALASQNKSRESLQKSIFESLTVSRYVEATIKKGLAVTSEELAKYYASNAEEFRHPDIVKTSHILIKAAGNTAEQDDIARKRAEALLARIKKGEDFARLAKENSVDSSASKGGDIGFASREGLAPEYAEAAFSLPTGGVTLVKTQNGYHIIKVTDKKKEGLFTLEEIRPQLLAHLTDRKYQEELNKLVNQLREKGDVEILISVKELLNP